MNSTSVLVKTLLKANEVQDMKNLLEGLFTASEIEEFATRIEIIKLLKKGMGQHAIAKKLNIGVATVSRGAKELKRGNFRIIT